MNQVYSNFKKYDERGRRVAIFGWLYNEGKSMGVTVITCSTEDQFCKKTAKEAYKDWMACLAEGQGGEYSGKFHPLNGVVLEFDPEKPLKSFIQWCNKHYYFKQMMVTAPLSTPILSMKKYTKSIPLGVMYSCQLETLTKVLKQPKT